MEMTTTFDYATALVYGVHPEQRLTRCDRDLLDEYEDRLRSVLYEMLDGVEMDGCPLAQQQYLVKSTVAAFRTEFARQNAVERW